LRKEAEERLKVKKALASFLGEKMDLGATNCRRGFLGKRKKTPPKKPRKVKE